MKNPFLTSAKIIVLNKKTTVRNVIPIEEGTYKVTNESSTYNGVEVAKFTKFYKYPYQIGLLKQLSPTGCRMFLYCLTKVQEDRDWISLKREAVAKALEVKETSVGTGIRNLIDIGILCKKGRTTYWINPIVMYHGDRKKYFEINAPDNIEYLEDKNPTVINMNPVNPDVILY